MKKQFLEAGEFVSTHGIAGELRIYPWADDTSFLSRFHTLYLDSEGQRALKVEQIRPHKNICIAKIEGISSVEQARALIGQVVYISREQAALPKGKHFIQDLLGLAVVDDATQKLYGHIRAITHPGRHDVYEIEREDGSIVLFPAAPVFVSRIDIEAGTVFVSPISGMFED